MIELWQEVRASMSRNKLRTTLTGFSVAWGIFMLVVLLGAGNGLQNGAMTNMSKQLMNVISIYSWQTSLPFKGYSKGRQINLDKSDSKFIAQKFENSESVSGNFSRSTQAMYKGLSTPVRFRGVSPMSAKINGIEITNGRYLNDADMKEMRKVVVLEVGGVDILFPRENPIGKQILIDNVYYKVIGISSPRNRNSSNINCYIPLSTAEGVYGQSATFYSYMSFLINDLDTKEENILFNKELKNAIAEKHQFDKNDEDAIYIENRYEQFVQVSESMGMMSLFLWVIGIGTLLAGIVGVSNIMLVTVRERMNEIGIRKSIGATPKSIIIMVLTESLVITLMSGYIGLVAGMGLMEWLNSIIEKQGESPDSIINQIFINPTVDMRIATGATIVLVIAGLIAGYIPARKAVRMKTIDAIRHNK